MTGKTRKIEAGLYETPSGYRIAKTISHYAHTAMNNHGDPDWPVNPVYKWTVMRPDGSDVSGILYDTKCEALEEVEYHEHNHTEDNGTASIDYYSIPEDDHSPIRPEDEARDDDGYDAGLIAARNESIHEHHRQELISPTDPAAYPRRFDA